MNPVNPPYWQAKCALAAIGAGCGAIASSSFYDASTKAHAGVVGAVAAAILLYLLKGPGEPTPKV